MSTHQIVILPTPCPLVIRADLESKEVLSIPRAAAVYIYTPYTIQYNVDLARGKHVYTPIGNIYAICPSWGPHCGSAICPMGAPNQLDLQEASPGPVRGKCQEKTV